MVSHCAVLPSPYPSKLDEPGGCFQLYLGQALEHDTYNPAAPPLTLHFLSMPSPLPLNASPSSCIL